METMEIILNSIIYVLMAYVIGDKFVEGDKWSRKNFIVVLASGWCLLLSGYLLRGFLSGDFIHGYNATLGTLEFTTNCLILLLILRNNTGTKEGVIKIITLASLAVVVISKVALFIQNALL